MPVKPVKIDYFQCQPMYSDADFDEKSDFSIKRDLDHKQLGSSCHTYTQTMRGSLFRTIHIVLSNI
jgi:hypothetical protein